MEEEDEDEEGRRRRWWRRKNTSSRSQSTTNPHLHGNEDEIMLDFTISKRHQRTHEDPSKEARKKGGRKKKEKNIMTIIDANSIEGCIAFITYCPLRDA